MSNPEQKEIILDDTLVPITIVATDITGFNSGIANGKQLVRDVVQGPIRHQNFIEYLATAWKSHYGVVVSPDFIWHIILNEIAGHIKSNASHYQDLFSKSEGKVEIIVPTGDNELLPLDTIMEQLAQLVPTDIDIFRPNFSTSTASSSFAMMATFADAMSPFYNYSMYMCGITKVKLLGSNADWDTMLAALDKLSNLLPKLKKYLAQVSNEVKGIAAFVEVPSVGFWKKMFSLEKCGSGKQVEVKGWITNFFIKKPSPAYVNNYPTCVSYVKYKNITTGVNYELVSGLFSSTEEDGYLIPDFGYLILGKIPKGVIEEDFTVFAHETPAYTTEQLNAQDEGWEAFQNRLETPTINPYSVDTDLYYQWRFGYECAFEIS